MAGKEVQKQEQEKEKRYKLRSRSSVCEDEGKILVKLEMPGVTKNNLDINVDNNQLEIFGKREEPEIEGKYVVRERRYGDYYQVYTIDDTIDRNKIDASLDNGLLTVTLHLKEAEKPKKIAVKAG
jgi:HSP20 family protein